MHLDEHTYAGALSVCVCDRPRAVGFTIVLGGRVVTIQMTT